MMLATVMIWGLNFVAVKLVLREFSPMAFIGLRFTMATAVIWLFLWQRTRGPNSSESVGVLRRDVLFIIGLGLLGHTLYQLLFVYGMTLTTAANSSLLLATAPIWVAVLGYLLHIERISRVTWYGILLSFCGILILILGGGGRVDLGGTTIRGDLLLLASAIVWAVHTTASKPLLARYSPLKLTSWTMLAGTIPLAIISIPAIRQQDWAAITPVGWAALFDSIVFGCGVPGLVHQRAESGECAHSGVLQSDAGVRHHFRLDHSRHRADAVAARRRRGGAGRVDPDPAGPWETEGRMTARIFELAYQLRLHRVGGWALDRWAVTLAWGASALILTQWAWRGQPVLPAWHWLILALLLLSGAAVMALRGWAARRSYVVFLPEPGLALSGSAAAAPRRQNPVARHRAV